MLALRHARASERTSCPHERAYRVYSPCGTRGQATALRVLTKGARSHDLSTSRSVHTHSRGPQSDRLLASLFQRWNVDYFELKGFAPCSKAARAELKCLQFKGAWDGLRSLNRPALITLAIPDGKRVHAVVSSLRKEDVTLLVGQREIVIATDQITAFWTGEYMALWKAPPVFKRQMRPGMKGPDVAWLSRRLSQIDGGKAKAGEATVYDTGMKARVMEFQRKAELEVDGVVGPRTVIRLNIAAKAPAEPVLHRPDF